MTFRYIGSKARLVNALAPHLGIPSGGGRFVDMFCGTGAVTEMAASAGWSVVANDNLLSAVTMTAARLIGTDTARFKFLGSYANAIGELNTTQPVEGVLWKLYSPASARHCGIERRYFTEENARKLDAMRKRIASWKSTKAITPSEETLLLADLLSATNRAANIAGTYGCFLSKWQRQALAPVNVIARNLPPHSASIEAMNCDVFDVRSGPEDTVYLDPPYSKRQYASYYHILETVVLNDEPMVEGVCGLREWRHKSSPFCFKRKALDAVQRLVEGLRCSTVLISYSDEGHVNLLELVDRLAKSGEVSLIPLDNVGRYRPNTTARDNRSAVTEHLIVYNRREIEKKNVKKQEAA